MHYTSSSTINSIKYIAEILKKISPNDAKKRFIIFKLCLNMEKTFYEGKSVKGDEAFDAIDSRLIPAVQKVVEKEDASQIEAIAKNASGSDTKIINDILQNVIERIEYNHGDALAGDDDSELDDSPSEIMGKYAWPQNRIKKTLPYEKDTRREVELFRAITDMINHNVSFSQSEAEDFMSILSTGMYNDVVAYAKGDKIYRGIVVDENQLRVFCRLNSSELVKDNGNISGNYEFTPYNDRFSSSWTTNHEVAKKYFTLKKSRFSKPGMRNYGVIMHAPISTMKTRCMSVQKFEDNVNFENYWGVTNNEEVLVLGNEPIIVSKIEWFLLL